MPALLNYLAIEFFTKDPKLFDWRKLGSQKWMAVSPCPILYGQGLYDSNKSKKVNRNSLVVGFYHAADGGDSWGLPLFGVVPNFPVRYFRQFGIVNAGFSGYLGWAVSFRLKLLRVRIWKPLNFQITQFEISFCAA